MLPVAVPMTWLDAGCCPVSFHRTLVDVVFLCVFPTVEVVEKRRLVSSCSFWFRKFCWLCSMFLHLLISMPATTLGMAAVCFSIESFVGAVFGGAVLFGTMSFVLLLP